jgi:hypothetical protein
MGISIQKLKKRATELLNKKSRPTKIGINPCITRPFNINDLKTIPERWSCGKGPNFVGIAAPKAGTTWWYSLLKQHPQIVDNRLKKKELHYFLHFKHFGLDENQILTYRMAFAAPEGSICGEWTPSYLSEPFAIEYLKVAAPDTKILILLRNPVDQAISLINQNTNVFAPYFSLPAEKRYIYEKQIYSRSIRQSRYASAIRRLLGFFDRDKVLLLQYEKCKLDPDFQIEKTYQFLDVDSKYKPQMIRKTVNQKEYLVSLPSVEERKRLASYYRDDVNQLIEIFPEIDLSLWQDFK